VIKRLFGETCLFEVPASYDKNREIIKDAVK